MTGVQTCALPIFTWLSSLETLGPGPDQGKLFWQTGQQASERGNGPAFSSPSSESKMGGPEPENPPSSGPSIGNGNGSESPSENRELLKEQTESV